MEEASSPSWFPGWFHPAPAYPLSWGLSSWEITDNQRGCSSQFPSGNLQLPPGTVLLLAYCCLTEKSEGHNLSQNWLYLCSSLWGSTEGHKSNTWGLDRGSEVEEGLRNETGNGRKQGKHRRYAKREEEGGTPGGCKFVFVITSSCFSALLSQVWLKFLPREDTP